MAEETELTQDTEYVISFTENGAVTIQYVPDSEDHGSTTNNPDQVKPATGTPKGSVATAEEGWAFVNWTKGDRVVSWDKELKPEDVEKVDGVYVDATYVANFAEDSNGDDIPDMYQIKVTYKGENGTVDIADPVYVTLYKDGHYATAEEGGVGYLAEGEIAKATANPGYNQESESWNPTKPVAEETELTQDTEYVISFEPKNNTPYKVEYYYQNYDGNYPATTSEWNVRYGTTDTLATVSELDKVPKKPGFIFDEDNELNKLSGNIDGDGSLILKVYFERGIFAYTVIEHYENADGVETATVPKHGTGVFEESIIELSGVKILQNKEYEGHTYTLTGVDGHDKLISPDETKNVIHIYYALDEKGGTDPENPDNPGSDDVPDKYQLVFTYVSADENTGTVTGTTREVYTFKDAAGNYVENTGISPNAIEGHNPVASPAENYAFHYWTVQGQEERDYTVGMTFLGQKVYTTDTTFVAHFAEDKINDTTDGEDPNVPEDPNQPDGIPDIYQIVFTYVTEDATHGTVDGMVTEVRTFPRNGETGEYDTTAAISPNVGVTITTIGRYRFDNWTNGAGTVYDTDDLLRAASFTEDQTFTAHFYRAPGSGSGDGGNGGGGTSTPGGPYNPGAGPGVTITEPEVPLAPLPTENGGSTVIFDDNVPLAPLPKTGQQSLKTPITMLLAGIFLAFASLTKRKEEN